MTPTRRRAIVALCAFPLGYFRAMRVHAQGTGKERKPLPVGPAHLTIDLDQWSGIQVEHQGKTTFVSSADIFAALKGAGQ